MINDPNEKKEREHIFSPEELRPYLRVTSPRLWMLLSSFLVLLAGFIIYACTVKMENTMPVKMKVISGPEAGYDTGASGRYGIIVLPLSQKEDVSAGMAVRISGGTGKVSQVVTDEEKGEVILIIEQGKGIFLPVDGEYEAELVLESVTPIRFLWN